MDLFGDLPPPSDSNGNNTGNDASSLYDGISINPKKTASKRTNEDDEKPDLMVKRGKDNEPSQNTLYAFKSFHAERQGEREEMQDALTLLDDCTDDFASFNCGHPIDRVSFFGLYDGHGGRRASTFVKENLYTYIKNNFPNDVVEKFDAELKKRITKAFKETDDAFIYKASQETPNWRDGSTATCVLAINNILYVPNVGDSKTIIVRETKEGKSSILSLTKDHSPTDYEERQRIQNAGGFVRDGRVQGVLEVSRAFGDAKFKKYVTCTPDITKCTLTENDQFLIIACDGLWKGFRIQDAVTYIKDILKDSSISDIDERYEKACSNVASEAIRRGSSDNVSVVLVRISAS